VWFLEELPKLREEAESLGLLEFTQEAGEVVYLPEGWWHAVLNVSDDVAMAVTHNAVLPETAGLWPRLQQTHPEFVAAYHRYNSN
jgi:oxalate decarboxylase/phosphoglucose isomerase-like protein (cupin superfamily)